MTCAASFLALPCAFAGVAASGWHSSLALCGFLCDTTMRLYDNRNPGVDAPYMARWKRSAAPGTDAQRRATGTNAREPRAGAEAVVTAFAGA